MTKYCTPHTKQKLMPSSTKSQVLTSFLLDLILFQAWTTSPALITLMLICICMCMCVWSLNSATTPELDRLWKLWCQFAPGNWVWVQVKPLTCFMSNCQSKFCFNRSVTVSVLVFNKYDDRCQSLDQMNYPILVWMKKGGSQCPYLFSVFCYWILILEFL